jgi:ribose transport system permease protein
MNKLANRPAETAARRTGASPAAAPSRSIEMDGGRALHLLGKFGLVMLLAFVLATFSIWKPDSFFAWDNFKATFAQQAIIVMVALAAMMPLVVGEFDLSVGANAGFASIFAVGLSDKQGLNPWLAILTAVAISGFVGLINGVIITRLKVNSFVATLGMATTLGGVGALYTHEQDLQSAPAGLLRIGRSQVFGLQMTVVVAIVLAVALAVALQYLAIGRQFLAVGANRRAAELTGIRPDRRILLAFVISGVIVGLGGALYGANLGAAGNSTGPTLLLPAFAGAFLGSTTITPGRYNVPGTLVAVLLLAFTVSGLEQVGVQPWIESVIQGVALIAAVAFSSWAIRLRTAQLRDAQLALLAKEDDASTGAAEATS